jgi:predicted peptidase
VKKMRIFAAAAIATLSLAVLTPAGAQTPLLKGDQQRAYHFAAAGRDMPYRLVVPQNYSPAVGAPLVVALHGFGGDQNYFFQSVPNLAELCEQYGFILVAPMGLAADGWYGAPLGIPGNAPRSGGRPPPTPSRTAEQEASYRALCEADVMNVIGLVRAEYRIDPRRIYLMGHSMGGFGTWWLGQKHAQLWAAIGPMSGVLPDLDYQLERLRNVAVHVSIGGAETSEWVTASRAQVAAMKELGITAEYFEPEGATHGSMIAPTVPRVLAFFAKHVKPRDAGNE